MKYWVGLMISFIVYLFNCRYLLGICCLSDVVWGVGEIRWSRYSCCFLEGSRGVGYTSCREMSCDGFRCFVVFEEFYVFVFGKLFLLGFLFMIFYI